MNDSEKDLTSKECATLAQLRSRYYRLIGSYKSRIKTSVDFDTVRSMEQTNGLPLGIQLQAGTETNNNLCGRVHCSPS